MKWSVERSVRKFARPLETSRGVTAERTTFLVTVEDGGLTGRGEATPLPELGGESIEEAARELASIERGVSAPSVRFAVEQALLELLARKRKVPVAALLSETYAREIQVNALAASVEEAVAAMEQGFGTVKLKVGARSPAEDIAFVRAVRDALGPEVKLRVDANGAWSFPVARDVLRSLCAMDLECCEQPTRDLEELGRLRAVGIPIALDEGLVPLVPRTPLIPSEEAVVCAPTFSLDLRERCDLVVLKPALLGGLGPALHVARLAAEQGISSYVTAGYEGVTGRMGCAHLAAALPRQTHAHGLATGRLFGEFVAPSLPIGVAS